MAEAVAPKLVAQSGEKEGRRFAGHASKGQENGGEDAAISSGNNDRGDGLPLTGAKRHGPLAQVARHGQQKLFGAAQSDRNHYDAEGNASCESGEMPQGLDHQAVCKDADDDGRRPVE